MTNRIENLDGERDRRRREIAADRAKLERQLAALVALAEPEAAVEACSRYGRSLSLCGEPLA